jgi:hypothetical protein
MIEFIQDKLPEIAFGFLHGWFAIKIFTRIRRKNNDAAN